jgi:heat shock protein HslJ
MNHLNHWIRLALGVLALGGLVAGRGTMASAAEPASLDGTAWVLTGLPGHTLVPDSSVTLQFSEGRLSGSDGCNRYAGSYSVKNSVLAVAPNLASTQMACMPDINAQAQAYIAALTGAKSYRIDGERLDLLAANGKASATFAAQSRSLAGTSWSATGINNGRQAVASLAKDSSVTMDFGKDGVVSGSAGCNRYTATYKSDGSSLTIGQAAVTRMMCAEPAGVMEQEQQFLRALSTVATARFEGERLELRTAEGALAVSLSR